MEKQRRQRGSSLLGILIALVVIAVGGVAISGLMGNMTSGSGEAKARNEALELAQEKVEELRNFIELAKFESDLPAGSSTPESIQGKNAQFSREWVITDDATLANLKKIIMQVSYVDPADPVEADGTTARKQKVLINSFIAFSDPTKSGTIATGGTGETGGAAPSNDRSAIEGPEPNTTTTPGTLDEEGDPGTTNDNIYTSVNSNGSKVVYQGLVTSGDVPDENIKLTVFGGVILKFSGALHYATGGSGIRDPENLYLRATSPSFSTWFPTFSCDPLSGNGFDCGLYVSYASGDCSDCYDKSSTDPDPASGVCVDTAGQHVCPVVNWNDPDDSNIPVVNKIIDLNLNGGWYGKVGVFYLGNGNDPLSCLVQDDGSGEEKVPARLYVSQREAPGTIEGFFYEGINTPYADHDFLHVKRKQDCSETPNDVVLSEIVRCIDKDSPNLVRVLNDPYYANCTW